MKLYLRQVMLSLIITSLAACSVLPEAEKIQIYHLPVGGSLKTISEPRLSTTLSVVEPNTLRSLNTSRISEFSNGQIQRYYAGARWADRAPTLVQQSMIQTLQSTDLFSQVVNKEMNLSADYIIHSNLRAFQIENSESGETAHVILHVTLVNQSDQEVLGSTRLTEQASVTGSSMPDATAALGKAMDNINTALSEWVYISLKPKTD
ncbi:ABC-type transport auxiliary lipoprotein family protein [Idiomarina aminovorans]|uniref:ABC-type transport auxiliary lipoprotein family protein n=1 Tax=Idiomarina aminovorans TaxID=2914829 RepID=UPI0020068CA8|nr:ABC-type transport auxiliary lipoprotein family protein [Idiomarina sp. ATCH4]MCK7460040.1 ABC-type transport auxiliary lipoprotein family protein [Idiomarina sp. ATCH4]